MRGLNFMIFVLSTLLFAVLVMLLSLAPKRWRVIWIAQALSRWSRWILALFSIRVQEYPLNQKAEGAHMIVSNHVSYLDIPVLLSRGPAVFVAKREVASWPLIGFIARRSGVVFVDRANLRSRAEALLTVQKRLREGVSVVIFPEGTTSVMGPRRGTSYFTGAFRAARMEDRPLEVLYLEFEDEERCAWIGAQSFLPHLWAFLGGGTAKVKLRSTVYPQVLSRSGQRRVAQESRNWLLEGGNNLLMHTGGPAAHDSLHKYNLRVS